MVDIEERLTWYRMDLHLHTPASTDYQEPDVSYLDILRRADERHVDILAFTDHNSVRGYAELWRQLEDLELLEHLGRLLPEEAARLSEYRRLLDKLLLLPGFEFTATFGFHILAIFPEHTSVRLMEHLLLLLGVDERRFGSGEVGATTDVLRAYEILADHGALVIGAHVNSTNGIAMQGIRFGGQTKIAYTQDRNLHALEVTDLNATGNRRSTARFFNGTKPEYPRRMHSIQGSDAHRLSRDPDRPVNLGVGDRTTEVQLPELSFQALKALFLSEHFERTKAHVDRDDPFEVLRAARSDGNTATQAFHESLSTKRSGAANFLRDLVAFANGDGGTIFLGASPNERRPVAGIGDLNAAIAQIESLLASDVTPPPAVEMQRLIVGGKQALAVRVASGPEKPYAANDGGIFVRRGGESVPASRNEIVAMVRGAPVAASTADEARERSSRAENGTVQAELATDGVDSSRTVASTMERGSRRRKRDRDAEPSSEAQSPPPAETADERGEWIEEAPTDPITPRNGVEVVEVLETPNGPRFTLRDLRNGNLVHNVSGTTQRRLWKYATQEYQHRPVDPGHVRWRGDYGYIRAYRPRGEKTRHNLAYRGGDAGLRVFYGATEEGLTEHWRAVMPTTVKNA